MSTKLATRDGFAWVFLLLGDQATEANADARQVCAERGVVLAVAVSKGLTSMTLLTPGGDMVIYAPPSIHGDEDKKKVCRREEEEMLF